MTFTPNMPFDGESLGTSKPQVRDNFTSLRQAISNPTMPNHIDVLGQTPTGVDISGVPGTHIFIEMPVVTSQTYNKPLAGEVGVIAQTAASGSSELYLARDAGTYFQLTNGTPLITTLAGPPPSNCGTTFLPGGLIMKFGSIALTSTSQTVLFNTVTGADFPTNLLSLQAQVSGVLTPGLVYNTGGASSTGFIFQIQSVTLGNVIYFIAIGN